MQLDFTGTTAIVTGGTRGIGKSIVTVLAQCGCSVLYTGTNASASDRERGQRYEQLDLADDASVERFVTTVIPSLPRLDILVNNAGINIIESIDAIDDAHWESMLRVNLTGPMRLMRAAVQHMMRTGTAGRIVNISSMFGIVSKEKRSAYSASKTGLLGLTRAAALDVASHGILVNALCPGVTLTELTKEILSEKGIEEMRNKIPLGRCAEPEEIARVAAFLCSEKNTFMTGQAVVVDGGYSIV